MPGEPTTLGANLMLNAVSGRQTVSSRTMYLAVLTAVPNDASTVASMAEYAAGNGYSRQEVTFGAPTGDPSEVANTNSITFGAFSDNRVPATHLALVSSASGTGGDLVWYWSVDEVKDPAVNDSLTIAVGALKMLVD
jgi:hypothetical protein